MAKTANLEKWGRKTARERYASGGMAEDGYLKEAYDKIGSNATIDKRIRGELPPLAPFVPSLKSS